MKEQEQQLHNIENYVSCERHSEGNDKYIYDYNNDGDIFPTNGMKTIFDNFWLHITKKNAVVTLALWKINQVKKTIAEEEIPAYKESI